MEQADRFFFLSVLRSKNDIIGAGEVAGRSGAGPIETVGRMIEEDEQGVGGLLDPAAIEAFTESRERGGRSCRSGRKKGQGQEKDI
jgi:hypothetical protein